MNEIRQSIEQLEEAAQQLSKNTPTGARLALMLIDNLIELLMYKKVQLEFARYNQLQAIREPKYSLREQKNISKYFEEKVKFLLSETKIITQDQGEVLKVAHKLRNEAYHTGIIRKSILMFVASVYFETACNLLPNLWLRAYSWSKQDEIISFLRRYKLEKHTIDVATLTKICDAILEGRTCKIPELCKALANDLQRRIENTLSGLDYLADSDPSPEEILKNMQFSEMLTDNYNFAKTDEGFEEFVKVRNKLFPSFKPPITVDVLNQWKERAETIMSETSPGSALRKFLDLDSKLLPIEQKIGETVFEYDEMINAEIHDRRL